MDKQLMFNYVDDMDGVRKRYPKNPDLVALFLVPDEDFDLQYYIYAACTKRDFSNPDLIHVSKEQYEEIKSFFKSKFNIELAENLLDSIEEIYLLLQAISDAVTSDNQTIGEMLKLN